MVKVMITSFLTVGQQVLVLFVFIGIGFIIGKAKLLDTSASKGITNIVLYVVVPANIIVSFQGEFFGNKISVFALVVLITVILHVINIVIAKLFSKDADAKKKNIMQFAAVFSNCGFIGYPLMSAILGPTGVLYGSAFVVTSIVLIWVYGVYMITGDKRNLSIRLALFNPGVIGVAVAVILSLLGIKLSSFTMSTLSSLASLNTPLPMMIIGYQMSKARFDSLLRHSGFWFSSLLRLVIFPLLSIIVVLLFPIPFTAALAVVIGSATPAASIAGMFAERYGGNTEFTSSLITAQTALSILTMPIIVAVAQIFLS